MNELLNADLTAYTEEELVELRNKINAQISRLRNTGMKYERRLPSLGRTYKFSDKELARRFYYESNEILGRDINKQHRGWIYKDNNTGLICFEDIYLTKEEHLKITYYLDLIPETYVFTHEGKSYIRRVRNTYRCSEKVKGD